ncbi:MAG: hypothetical protein GKS06_02465 [Acidobacteria bacterium]|nr:hypothetical protein [Acidobacteriota bacterium]
MGKLDIANPEKVTLWSIRDDKRTFDIRDDRIRSWWAKKLSEARVEVLILDCVRPVLDVLGLDQDRDAGKFLEPLAQLLAEAGIDAAIITQHMGHEGTRTRGDSRWREWPDVEWRIKKRQKGQDRSPRVFSAFGRDVDVDEFVLEFDSDLNTLLARGAPVNSGARRKAERAARTQAAQLTILRALMDAASPLGTRAIRKVAMAEGHAQDVVEVARKNAIADGLITTERGAMLWHSITDKGRSRVGE